VASFVIREKLFTVLLIGQLYSHGVQKQFQRIVLLAQKTSNNMESLLSSPVQIVSEE
jgi:hypothetical protein